MISRRSLFRGLGAILAAPAVAKVASLIPPVEAARVRSLVGNKVSSNITLIVTWRKNSLQQSRRLAIPFAFAYRETTA